MGQEPADRRTGDGCREVHCRESLFFHGPFEMLRVNAGLTGHGQGFCIDREDFVHPLRVENDAPIHRQGTPLRTGAAAPRRHWDFVMIGQTQDLGRFLGRTGMDDELGLRIVTSAVVPHLGDPVVVDRVSELVGGIAGDVLRADRVGEFAADHREEVVFIWHGFVFEWAGCSVGQS